MKKEYKKGNSVVVWQPDICIHSGICARGLASVFKPKEKPWVQVDGASEAEIVEQVARCPSGALSIRKAD
jgi:uncharacterized Fe-S cluster protein YjdI